MRLLSLATEPEADRRKGMSSLGNPRACKPEGHRGFLQPCISKSHLCSGSRRAAAPGSRGEGFALWLGSRTGWQGGVASFLRALCSSCVNSLLPRGLRVQAACCTGEGM